MTTITYPPEAFTRGARVGAVAPSTSIRTQPDGVPKRSGIPASYFTHMGKLEVLNPETHLDVTAAMQIALYRLLSPMRMHRHRLESIVSGGPLETSSFEWTRVIFDMPRIGEQQDPLPAVAILASSACTYDYQSLDVGFCEDTVDVFAPDSVVRKLGTASQQFQLHCLSAHHEERRGIKAAFERTFMAEPDDDQGQRSVVIEEYFRRTARVRMPEADYPETTARDFANEHELIVTVDVDCDVCVLVKRPADIQPPINSVHVHGTPITPPR